MRVPLIILACVNLLGGCAVEKVPPDAPAPLSATVATRPADPRSDFTLDQIAPDAAQAITVAATQPSIQPSLDALESYLRGRAALRERNFYTAVDLLEKAARLDGASAQVQFELGRAQTELGRIVPATAALKLAAELRPDWLEVHKELARLYARTDQQQALRSLIVATKTRDYAASDADAAVVDYHLARLLSQNGHTRAAVEQYEKLLWRLSRKSLLNRATGDLAALPRVEAIQIELARVFEKRGMKAAALAQFQKVADKLPDAFDPQAQLVRALLSVDQIDPAAERAARLVRKFNASPASVALLREVYRRAGNEIGATMALRRLHEQAPRDRAILLALADVLAADGHADQAEALIAAAAASDGSVDLVRRLVRLYDGRGDTLSAARVIIEASARRPESTTEISGLWLSLIRPWRATAVRPDDVRNIALSADAEPARLYWLSRLAEESTRLAVAREALKQATQLRPVFEPAHLLRMQQIFLAADSGDAPQKRQEADALIAAARDAGNQKLALQLEAIAASQLLASPLELPAFEKALAAGDSLPEFTLSWTAALKRASLTQKYEQAMWKLLSDHPDSEQGFRELLTYYTQQNAGGAALKVVNTWLANDPRSLEARIAQAGLLSSLRQTDAAEAMLQDLVREQPQDMAVLVAMHQFFTTNDRAAQSVEFLQRQRQRDPQNGAAIQLLIELHLSRGETPAALKVLESAGAAPGLGANMLYFLAQFHFRLGEKEKCEVLMGRALDADPRHVPSSNDLAYFWADDGRNLARSEQLARQAAAAEPDNAAYLDTLGWALYKQARFDEARKYLEQAVAAAAPLDPVLLDHFGDVLYRVGDTDEATKQWRSAAELVGRTRDDREEIVRVRIRLETKLRQRAANEPVEVSPVVETRSDAALSP